MWAISGTDAFVEGKTLDYPNEILIKIANGTSKFAAAALGRRLNANSQHEVLVSPLQTDVTPEHHGQVRYLPKQQTLAFYTSTTPANQREGETLNANA